MQSQSMSLARHSPATTACHMARSLCIMQHSQTLPCSRQSARPLQAANSRSYLQNAAPQRAQPNPTDSCPHSSQPHTHSCPPPTSQQHLSSPTQASTHSRRTLLLAPPLLLPITAVLTSSPVAAVAAAEVTQQPSLTLTTTGLPSCPTTMSDPIAEAFIASVGDALQQLQVLDISQYESECAVLRDREFRYYMEARRQRIASDIAQEPVQVALSDKVYFNFAHYIAYKVVARHVVSPDQRTEFCRSAGVSLLKRIWPEGQDKAKQAATRAGGKATEADVVLLVQSLLGRLQEGGYSCRYQLVWGELPGGWPQDWMNSQPQLGGMDPLTDAPAAPGLAFQVKIHEPADIEASVALRSEEDGFWSRSVSSMLQLLLSSAGYPRAYVDEYFFQDVWEGPRSTLDRVLLGLGDPLEQVGIDFLPSTLVQDWELMA